MEVTVRDIASQLDLSAATVSRSLRHDTAINPKTRARVNEAAHRMGYKQSRLRKPVRSARRETATETLGLLLRHNSIDDVRNDTNLTKMMAGIMAVADTSRVLLQLHTIHHDEQRHMDEDPTVIPPIVQKKECQAFIVRGEHNERDIAFLAALAPVVSMGRIYRTLAVDAVVGDNTEGIQELVSHLVKLGHRHLAWVGTTHMSTFMRARKAGFIEGCLEHHLSIGSQFFGPELYGTCALHDKSALLSALNSGITAFVCGNDAIAHRLIKVLEEVGCAVPADVSVTGFDATLETSHGLHLTTVDPHFFELGQIAARQAIQRITQPATHPCIVSVRGDVVHGDTTAPPDIEANINLSSRG